MEDDKGTLSVSPNLKREKNSREYRSRTEEGTNGRINEYLRLGMLHFLPLLGLLGLACKYPVDIQSRAISL